MRYNLSRGLRIYNRNRLLRLPIVACIPSPFAHGRPLLARVRHELPRSLVSVKTGAAAVTLAVVASMNCFINVCLARQGRVVNNRFEIE